MKIIIWILGIIGTGFFGGYLYFSNQDLANIIFYVSYYVILIVVLVSLWKIFSGTTRVFGYDHFQEKFTFIGIVIIFLGIFTFILTIGFLRSELFENTLRKISINISNRFEIEKGKAPIINLSSNTQTGITK